MQLPGKATSLPLLRLDQLPTHLLQSLPGQFLVSHVTRRTNVAGKGAICVESRHAIIENPAIFSVMSAEAILHLKRLAPIKRSFISIQATPQVVCVDPFRPAIPKFLVNGAPGESQPGLIEIGTQLVGSGHPYHHRSSVGDQSEAFLTFLKLFFRMFVFGDIRYHAHNPQQRALLVELSATASFHPDSRSVRAKHAKACSQVGILRTKLGKRGPKPFSIRRVNLSEYLLPGSL